jgi:predicted RNase H-like HicB family nuclease
MRIYEDSRTGATDMKMVITVSRTVIGRFRARCPALPGCWVDAQSSQEAVHCLRQAIRGYLASLDAVVPTDVITLELSRAG